MSAAATRKRRTRRVILVCGTGVLLFFFWTSLVRPAQLKAQYSRNNITCMARMEALGQALLTAARDNGGSFPDSLNDVVGSHGVTAQTLICPCSRTLGAAGTSPYVYFPGHQVDDTDRAELILLYEPNGQRACFLDGSVRFLQKYELDAALARTRQVLLDRNSNSPQP